MTTNIPVATIFRRCVEAVQSNILIRRESRLDKEFHFQNWFRARLEETGLFFEMGGRNTYPDFTLVQFTEGYEVKGLAYPGRDATFDANSQVPSGFHNGRTIYYVFGRYPKNPDGDSYPLLDLVICHGDFLNASHDYIHKNRSVKGFGSYGDIMIRDRKMYVVPTPFRLIEGVAHHHTLVLPSDIDLSDDSFYQVGELLRVEAAELIVAYKFDLETNTIEVEKIRNPAAGTPHKFYAWRLRGSPSTEVSMRAVNPADLEKFFGENNEDESASDRE